MALSEHEQRLLDEMERGFYQSEADVVEARAVRRRMNYRSMVLGILVVVVGLAVLVGGVAAQQLWLGLIGFAVMIGGVLLMMSRSEAVSAESTGNAPGVGSAPGERASRESLSERMERRWDDRMDPDR